jgi:hypothetical protein
MAGLYTVITAIKGVFGDDNVQVDAVPKGTVCKIVKFLPDGYAVLIDTEYGVYETTLNNLEPK